MLESSITALEATAVPTAVLPISNALSSPTTAVIPSRVFISAAVAVTPSRILSSAGVEVIAVVVAAGTLVLGLVAYTGMRMSKEKDSKQNCIVPVEE